MKNLAGQRHGRLVAICDTGERVRKNVIWSCLCDCGKTREVKATEFSRGRARSCGCLKSEEQSLRARKRPYESLFNSIDKNRKCKDNTLTYEQFLEFVEQSVCHYCGDQLYWSKIDISKHGQYNLDRKNNAIGYTKDNCVVCCWECNKLKSSRNYEEFVARVKKISERLK